MLTYSKRSWKEKSQLQNTLSLGLFMISFNYNLAIIGGFLDSSHKYIKQGFSALATIESKIIKTLS